MRKFLILVLLLILAFVAWAFFFRCNGKLNCTLGDVFPASDQSSTPAEVPPTPTPEPTTETPPAPTPAPTPTSETPPAPQPSGDLKDPNGDTFTYRPPGELVPNSGSGITAATIYVPGMRYPLEAAPSFPNSQVYGHGGGEGPGGTQCDKENYSYPWHDDFCEKRGWDTPVCPGAKGHQGQDIRPATCKRGVHWAVAAEAGQITNIGTFTVTLVGESGIRYRYLHMKMDALAVKLGDTVTRGQHLGLVSNDFGGSSTTIHLHFEIKTAVMLNGVSQIQTAPPYTSLVDSYKRLLQGTP